MNSPTRAENLVGYFGGFYFYNRPRKLEGKKFWTKDEESVEIGPLDFYLGY